MTLEVSYYYIFEIMNRQKFFFKSKVAGTAILASSGLVCKASAENPPTVNENQSMLGVGVLVEGADPPDTWRRYKPGVSVPKPSS